MERNRKYVMTEDDRSNTATALFAPRKEGQVMRKPLRQPGSLEIIENGERKIEKERPPSESSSRSWSRASIGSVPPRSESSLSRRTITPTKQISLQAVRRKEESSDPFVDNIDIDLDSVVLDSTRQRTRKWRNDDDFRPLSENSFLEDEFIDLGVADDHSNTAKKLGAASSIDENSIERKPKSDIEAKVRSEPAAKMQTSYKQGDGRKEEPSSEEEDDEDEEVKLRAPNELLMEFVDCLMKKDYPNADKLCKMILLYEPENTEALTFQPLIEEKMQLDAEAAEEGESDDEDEDDSDDSDDSDDDDDTTSSDDDSSEDSVDDDAEEHDKIENIPSTSSKGPGSCDMKGANSIRAWMPAS